MGHRTRPGDTAEARDRDLRRAQRRRREREILPPGGNGLRQRLALPRANCPAGRGPGGDRGESVEEVQEIEKREETLNGVPVSVRRLVIGICGGTGSGKTTITDRIIASLPGESVLVLQQDHYYKDLPHLPLDERAKQNFDHPDSIDTPLLSEYVRRMREGQPIDRPVYDFTQHRRLGKTVRLEPRLALIIEGIL